MCVCVHYVWCVCVCTLCVVCVCVCTLCVVCVCVYTMCGVCVCVIRVSYRGGAPWDLPPPRIVKNNDVIAKMTVILHTSRGNLGAVS